MNVFILGICGTFMGGVASLAKQAGFTVSGCDAGIYPPMSDLLQQLGIEVYAGYDPKHFIAAKPDIVIVGNALSRGNPCVEAMLNSKYPYISGPQWLAEYLLRDRTVLAVAGTHGKTTTTSILTWILSATGHEPGYLIGGVAENFEQSAAIGKAPFFVIEADEYDTAFFDKRPKFIHYHPEVLIANNLEYDHADIYTDLAAIERQFHYLLRTVPSNGHVIAPTADAAISRSIAQGCWSPVSYFGDEDDCEWRAEPLTADASEFAVYQQGHCLGKTTWSMFGMHNMFNALAAIIAANKVGVAVEDALAVLPDFQGIKRRLEVRGTVNNVTVYDDFAHHPTAIAKTIQALRRRVGNQRILAVVHFASNSMVAGTHLQGITNALQQADWIACAMPNDASWDLSAVVAGCDQSIYVETETDVIVDRIRQAAKPGDHVLVMSNKGFGGIHQKILDSLQTVGVA